MDHEVIAVMEVSTLRRYLAVAVLGGAALVVFNAAFMPDLSIALRFGGVAFGCLALVAAVQVYIATKHRVELTREELRDSSGVSIARLEDIASLDRGFLAFKPSNGVALRMHASAARTWKPGLWWRFGRRIGLGGIVSAQQTRFLSDRLGELLAKSG